MATTAKATAYLELNIAGFEQAIKAARNLMISFAAGFSAYKLGTFFKDGVQDAIRFGSEMANVSRTMAGFDAGNILLVQKALEKTGMGADEAQGHIRDFISQGRSLSSLFGGEQNFSKALKNASEDYGKQAGILTRSATTFQTIWNTIQAIAARVRTFFMAMTEEFTKPFQAVLELFESVDIESAGIAFGKSISDAVTMLIGLFKSGNLFEIARTGLTVAFKESVNYLIGGFDWIISTGSQQLREKLGDAFEYAVGFIEKAFEFISSPEALIAIAESFVGIATKFTNVMLEGINNITKVFAVGLEMAMNAAVDMIPGLSDFLGTSREERSFGEMFEDAEGLIPKEFREAVRSAGEELNGSFSDAWAKFMGEAATPSESGGFQKRDFYDTKDDVAKLGDLVSKSFDVGKAAIDAVDPSKHAAVGSRKEFTADPARAIADNLARVGGGGNYLQVGLTLQEKQLMEQRLTRKATQEIRDFYAKPGNMGPEPPKRLGRG